MDGAFTRVCGCRGSVHYGDEKAKRSDIDIVAESPVKRTHHSPKTPSVAMQIRRMYSRLRLQNRYSPLSAAARRKLVERFTVAGPSPSTSETGAVQVESLRHSTRIDAYTRTYICTSIRRCIIVFIVT